MVKLGFKYISIFKKTFFHPFITLQPAYKQLSIDRQNYSNAILDFLNIEVEVVGQGYQAVRSQNVRVVSGKSFALNCWSSSL